MSNVRPVQGHFRLETNPEKNTDKTGSSCVPSQAISRVHDLFDQDQLDQLVTKFMS